MSRLLAGWIYRWRVPLSIFIVIGGLLQAPRANITHIDNDITAWFSKDDPVYKDYERFRAEFGGTRALIIALKADSPDRLFSRPALEAIERITGDIERVDTVQQVNSLATATLVEAIKDGGDEGGLEVRPLLENLASRDPADIRRRALADDLIRGDLVSEDGATTAIIVGFDEDRIDEVRAGVIQQIHDIVDPKLPPGVRAYYNGSLEISETYNRITLDNQRRFTPPILLITVLAIYVAFRSWRKTLLAMFAVLISLLWTLGLYSLMGFSYNVLASMLVPLIVVLAIADDVHIMQHWDEAAAPWRQRARVQGDCRAPDGAPPGRERDDGARNARARHEQRRCSQGVRHRVGGRHHGRFRHLDRIDADAAHACEAGDVGGAARALFHRAAEGDCTLLLRQARSRARCDHRALDRRGTRYPALARRHEPHQLLQRPASARAVGRSDRQGTGRRLQLPDHARRAAPSR